MSERVTIGVLGSGAWGTAIASVLAHNGHKVILWCREPEVAAAIDEKRVNEQFLPGIIVHENIIPIISGEQFPKNLHSLWCAVPVQYMRLVLSELQPSIKHICSWVVLSKGIERDTGLLPADIIKDVLGEEKLIAAVVGPSFASDLAKAQPAGMTVAGEDRAYCKQIKALLDNDYLFITLTNDFCGAQFLAAFKNVIAIAVGLLEGYGFGENTQVLCIMRMLGEGVLLLKNQGGKEATLAELCGIGDILLACRSKQSRNVRAGIARAHQNPEVWQSSFGHEIVEGLNSLEALHNLDISRRRHDLPLTTLLYEVLGGKRPASDLIALISH